MKLRLLLDSSQEQDICEVTWNLGYVQDITEQGNWGINGIRTEWGVLFIQGVKIEYIHEIRQRSSALHIWVIKTLLRLYV